MAHQKKEELRIMEVRRPQPDLLKLARALLALAAQPAASAPPPTEEAT